MSQALATDVHRRDGLASFGFSMEGTEQRVFISYSEESRTVALPLGEYLAERGWRSSIGQQISAGESWQEAVAREIERADAVVLLVGSQPSEALRFEWSLALRARWQEEQKKVIPVLMLGAEAPPFLHNLAAVRLTDDVDEEGFKKVLDLISSEAGGEGLQDAADEQARLMKRLDQAIESLQMDSPNETELKEHRRALASSLETSSGSAKTLLYLSIGLLDAELGDNESARIHLEGALAGIESEEQPDDERLLTVLMSLGDAQSDVEDYGAAIETYERVRSLQSERSPNSVGEAAALQGLGIALVQGDRPEEAREPLARALEISRESLGKKHPRVSGLELWLAIAAEASGDYETAKAVYEEALASREEVEPEDLNDQVARLMGLGHALRQLGDLEGARQSLRRALDLGEGAEVDPESMATVLMALGDVEIERGNLAEACLFLARAIEWQRRFEIDTSTIAVSQVRLGWSLLRMGELPEAKKVLSEALISGEEAGGSADGTVIDALYMLALVAREEEDRPQAEKRLRQAIDLQTQRDSSDERRLSKFRQVLDEVLGSSAPAA